MANGAKTAHQARFAAAAAGIFSAKTACGTDPRSRRAVADVIPFLDRGNFLVHIRTAFRPETRGVREDV